MITMVNTHISFDGEKALDGLSLSIKDKTLLGIMGPGGCGKSTLCKVACGLIIPDSGIVMVDGVDLVKSDRKTLEDVHRQCGFQFQNDALFEHMTVLANVEYPLYRLTNLNKYDIEARAIEHLAMVGLAGFENREPNNLSGGQRRRVALARACVTDPKILICDDPTAGLDPVTSRIILDLIVGIQYQIQSTVLVVSSDIVGLLSVSHRAALVWEGKIIAEGTSAQIRESKKLEVIRFLDDAKLPFRGWTWD